MKEASLKSVSIECSLNSTNSKEVSSIFSGGGEIENESFCCMNLSQSSKKGGSDYIVDFAINN